MDIVSERETKIYIADADALFPAKDVFPAEDLYPADANVREVTNIVAGSLRLDEMICESIPQFGRLFSTKFECQVYYENDISGKFIHVYQQDGNVLSDIFTGKIDSCKLDKVGTDRKIIAYDEGYIKGQTDVAPWWTNFWQTRQSATLKQVRDSLLDYCGIGYEDVTLLNDDLVVTKTVDLSTATMSSILQMICELNCCFPHFNRSGYMEFIIPDVDATAIDLTGKYEWMSSDFEDFVTSEISGVQFFDSGAELKQTYGLPDNAYPVKKNIFLYEKDAATLDAVGEVMLDYLSEFHFTPAKVKMIIGDFNLNLGDYVHTEKGNFYIFENSYSGSQFIEQSMTARGTQILYDSVRGFDYDEVVLNEKIAHVRQTVDEFLIEYANFKEDTSAKFQLTSESIQSEVTRATGAESALSTQIQQTAESISLTVTNGESSSSFVLKLGQATLSSGSITFNGMVTFNDLSTSGSTTINGDNITTGTIDASQVTVSNLNASNITTGNLSADRITTGTMSADRIRGGTLELGQAYSTSGSAIIYSSSSSSGNIYLNSNGILVGGSSTSSASLYITGSGLTVKNGVNGDIILSTGGYQNSSFYIGTSSAYTKISNSKLTVHSSSGSTEIDGGNLTCDGTVSLGGSSKTVTITGGSGVTITSNATYAIYLKGYVKIGDSTSNKIGFYGGTGDTRQTVNKLSSSATLANVITKVNDLLTALAKYNLISSS